MDNDNELRELLAAYAHSAWSGWMEYLFGKCKAADGGGQIIPAGYFTQLTRQMETTYADLPESEKASDRAEADKMLAIVNENMDGEPDEDMDKRMDAFDLSWELVQALQKLRTHPALGRYYAIGHTDAEKLNAWLGMVATLAGGDE
jgi:hypothetical protein